MSSQAHEKKPNSPVTILPSIAPEEFVEILESDPDLFGTDDLIGLDIKPDSDVAE